MIEFLHPSFLSVSPFPSAKDEVIERRLNRPPFPANRRAFPPSQSHLHLYPQKRVEAVIFKFSSLRCGQLHTRAGRHGGFPSNVVLPPEIRLRLIPVSDSSRFHFLSFSRKRKFSSTMAAIILSGPGRSISPLGHSRPHLRPPLNCHHTQSYRDIKRGNAD